MATKINIPTPLRPFTGKQDVVEVDGATVGELLGHLTSRHEGLKKHLYNDEGKLRSFVNVYLNDEDIRYLESGEDRGEAGRHAEHHPVGRRRHRRGRGAPVTLNADEIKRYSRHLILPEVGMEGQKKLKAARVLCIGAGGLRLARGDVSGGGRRRHDRHRRFRRRRLSATCSARSSTARATSGVRSSSRPPTGCSEINPNVKVELYETASDIGERAGAFQGLRRHRRRHGQLPDAVPGQRRVRAARQAERLRLDLPLRGPGVGLLGRARGRATAACIPEPPPPGLVPSCAEGGVLGVLPGIVG